MLMESKLNQTAAVREIFMLFGGFGYTAEHMLPALREAGQRCAATLRPETGNLGKKEKLRELGVKPVLPEGPYPAETTHLMVTAPPSESGDPILAAIGGRQLRSLMPMLQRVGYISTTGVYGDAEGHWVTEDTPCRTSQPRSLARIAAERAWMKACAAEKLECFIFRVSGIYGPDYNSFEDIVNKTARCILKPEQVFNRVHVEDLAYIMRKCMLSGTVAPGIYNISDDEPASSETILTYAAQLIDKPPPPRVNYYDALPTLSPMQASFYAENKRVSNSKVKYAAGGLTLKYPTYREGLSALAQFYINM